MLPSGPIATRTQRAATRWLRLSCRARQLERAREAFSTSASRSPSKHLSKTIIEKARDLGHQTAQTKSFSSTRSTKAAPSRTPKLPDGPARTRFAPSPTGYLHIGGLRTALFSYLLARRTGGQFLVRIEDTDQKRLVSDAEQRLLDDLSWAGLTYDEGPGHEGPHGPYRQSERTEIYQDHARKLLDGGSAYRCFCVPQQSAMGDANPNVSYVTSGCYQNCSSLSQEASQDRAESKREAFTIRLHPPLDAHKRIYPDLIYGKIQRLKRSPAAASTVSTEDDTSIDSSDTILIKSDGTPTYHFANVVDDHLMHITHVIRGTEWMASTPLHYDIYSAFGWTPPQFAHVGLLVDQNKAKLSKRNLDMKLDVAGMRDEHGVLPDALCNFLALLGWSNPGSDDVMDLDELVKVFDLKFTRGNTMVRMEKLWFLQKRHVALRCEKAIDKKSLAPVLDVVSKIVDEVRRAYPAEAREFESKREAGGGGPDALTKYWTAILLADSKSYQNAKQFVERNRYFISRSQYKSPPEQEAYNKAGTISPKLLHHAMTDFMNRKYIPTHEDDITSSDPFNILHNERYLHSLLIEESWRQALNLRQNEIPFTDPNELIDSVLIREGLDSAASILDEYDVEGFIRATGDYHDESNVEALSERVLNYAKHALRRLPQEEQEAIVDVIEERRHVFQGALMKYLRAKLCGGLPGPSVSMVMAILGQDEVRARLGLEELV